MVKQPIYFYSNRVERLYSHLRKELFGESCRPFTKRIVVVPSQAMKRWLMLQLAQDKQAGISAGIDFPFLDRAIFSLSDSLLGITPPVIPDTCDLSFLIEKQIRVFIEEFTHLTVSHQHLLQPLFNYLQISGHQWDKSAQSRLVGLSNRLASLFSNYGHFSGSMIEKWNQDPLSARAADWQQLIWNSIFSHESHWCSFQRFMDQAVSVPPLEGDVQVHLFCLSFISKQQCRFFLHLAPHNPVYFHILSPCKFFWTDTRSDRESRRLWNYWKKQGVSASEREALEDYMRDTNPLLANWGRVGREYASQLEENEAIAFDEYSLPHSIAGTYPYCEHIDDEIGIEPSPEKPRLLDAVQADLLLMRNPRGEPLVPVMPKDDSIQLHSATTRLREVQALHDVLMEIIGKHRKNDAPITPSDIIVMAPRIADYVPYIKAVFESQENRLAVQFSDLLLSGQNHFARGFKQLIHLSLGRWKASELVSLFENQGFMCRHQLSQDDLTEMKSWIRRTNIRWGHDNEHRNEHLSQEYEGSQPSHQDSHFTWEHGLERMLQGYVQIDEDINMGQWPSSELSGSELLGKIWRIIRSLREDLRPLFDGMQMTLGAWISYLDCLLHAYFAPEPMDDEGQQDFSLTAAQILRLQRTAEKVELLVPSSLYSFASLLPHLQTALDQETLNYNEQHLQAVRFCSLLPMRAIPARVICLMGMEDSLYPRRELPCSFDLQKHDPASDYSPAKSDYDRYLFLESILSARDYFIMTYQGKDSGRGEDRLPSSLAAELVNYLDKHFSIEGCLPSATVVRAHPHCPYHWSYFTPEQEGHVHSSSTMRYQEACARYNPVKNDPHRFIPEFYIGHEKPKLKAFALEEQVSVDLKHLLQAVNKPLQVYLNHTLGMYVQGEEDEENKDEEPFACTSLDLWRYKNAYLNHSLARVLENDERSGRLPSGPWKEVAKRAIGNEAQLLHENLTAVDAVDERLLYIEFSGKCRRHTHRIVQDTLSHWMFPAPEWLLGTSKIQMTGSLPNVFSKGLPVLKEANFKEAAKVLPSFLYLHLVPDACHELHEKNLLMCGNGVKIPSFPNYQELLSVLLNYYFTCRANPCPVLPEWIEEIAKGSPEELLKKMKTSLSDYQGGTFDAYTRWVFKEDDLPDPGIIIDQWQGIFTELFGCLENVFSKEGKSNDSV